MTYPMELQYYTKWDLPHNTAENEKNEKIKKWKLSLIFPKKKVVVKEMVNHEIEVEAVIQIIKIIKNIKTIKIELIP